METVGARVVHAIPGRIRIKLPELRENPTLAGEIRQRLSPLRGIRQVEANPLTASLLVVYDPSEIDLADSLQCLQDLSTTLFDGPGLSEINAWLAGSGNGAVPDGSASRPRRGREAPEDEGSQARLLVPLSLLFLGLRRLLAGNTASPQWYDLVWFSFSAYHMLNRRSPGGRPPSPGHPQRAQSAAGPPQR